MDRKNISFEDFKRDIIERFGNTCRFREVGPNWSKLEVNDSGPVFVPQDRNKGPHFVDVSPPAAWLSQWFIATYDHIKNEAAYYPMWYMTSEEIANRNKAVY